MYCMSIKYPSYQIIGNLQVTGDPLDDYQRYYANQLNQQKYNFRIDVKEVIYKTNTILEFNTLPGDKLNHSLNCFEYQFPDILKLPRINNSSDKGDFKLNQQDYPTDDSSLKFLTKNQQFKLKKLQYVSQDHFINPNNCIIWDYTSGYVFFTGIWRLYQDVMKCLCTLERVGEDSYQRRWKCQQEFINGVTKYLCDPKTNSSVKLFKYDSNSTAYSDVPCNQLDQEWKKKLCLIFQTSRNLTESIEFSQLYKRIRGGYIKIQGTWLPYEVVREICIRFCFPIRFFLVPIFGNDFPQMCEIWLIQNQVYSSICMNQITFKDPFKLNKNLTTSGDLLLDASKDLLDISRKPSMYDVLPAQTISVTKPRTASWSIGDSLKYPLLQQSLPPISDLFNSLSIDRNICPDSVLPSHQFIELSSEQRKNIARDNLFLSRVDLPHGSPSVTKQRFSYHM